MANTPTPAQQTAGPWAAAPVGPLDFRAPDSDDYYIVTPDKTCVGIVWSYGKEGAANAAYIVQCVNGFAALQAENERLREALESIAANTCCDLCQEAALVARAALTPRLDGEGR